MRLGFSVKELLVVILVIGALLSLIIPAVIDAREAARASSCICRICQHQLAFENYASVNGIYPAVFTLGPDSKPWHSWRVEILPFIEHQNVYDRYSFDEPWNGPNNRLLSDQISVEIFQCPSGRDIERTQNTNYVVLVGPETIFPGKTGTDPNEILDGPENTIRFVECHNASIHWMEPRDLDASIATTFVIDSPDGPSISSPHPTGPLIGFADQECVRVMPSASPNQLRDLSTINGGETTTRADIESLPR